MLATKLYMPHRRLDAIQRARLTARLLDGFARPGSFTLISAPAGFGKTTLLSEFVAQLPAPRGAAWLSLDEGDNDPIRFWSYMVAACQSAQPHIGEALVALLQSPQPVPDEALATLLINDLAALEQRLLLILDDYHLIHNPSIHAALRFLLEHLPAQLCLVIATRVDPPWPLAHFRVRQQLVEMRAADLRFNDDEAAAFLNDAMQLELSPADIAALERRTEGWIASLQLAALSLKGRSDRTAFIRSFTGSHAYVAEYLVEEVLQRQPPDVRDFLLRTSILQRMNASLCEAVSGQTDGARRLREIQQANLFLVPLDDESEWYRYHQLFADLLQSRLRESLAAGQVAALHRAAMSWYEQNGMMAEAIDHALALPDYPHAVRLVEQVALPMILQAHVRTVQGWLQGIPAAQRETPRLDMAFAWLHLVRSRAELLQPYVERLNRYFAGENAEADASLFGEWLAIQANLCTMQGKPAESRVFADRALRVLPASDVHVRSMARLSLAEACEQLLDYEGAAATYQGVVQDAQASGNYIAEILGTSAHARMLLLQGRLHAAHDVALQGIQRMESTGRSTPFSATLYGELGQIHYQWHELDQARRYLGHSTQASGLTGYSDSEIYQHIMQSRICQMAGDWQEAAAAMEQAAALALRIPPVMTGEQIVSQQVRVDLALGRRPAAEAALQPHGFAFAAGFAYPALAQEAALHLQAALLYNSALRVVLHRVDAPNAAADMRAAVDLAGDLLEQELRCGEMAAALETLLLRSRLHRALGDEQAGLKDVGRALQLAEPEGFISPFVEEGPAVQGVLERLLDQPGAAAAFIRRVLECFPGSPPAAPVTTSAEPPDAAEALIEPLTRRELEVLQLIAAGGSNQSIADELVITLSAVKKHTGNIFRKLNVNSRTQALVRARALGLLSGG